LTSALTWPLVHGEITAGVESRWDRSRYENYFTTARRRDSAASLVTGRQLSGAPFVQSFWNLSDRFRLDLGARYDAFSTQSTPDGDVATSATHGVVSPKVGLLARLTSFASVFGNVSRGFRSTDGVISDPTLAPITEMAYEAGLKFDRSGASATASLFRMNVSNEQSFNPVTLEATNGGASRRQGLEIEWRAPVVQRLLTISGDVTLNDARYRSLVAVPDDGGAPVVLSGLRVYNTSKYVGVGAVDIAPISMPWRIRVSGNWVGPYSPFDEPGVVLGAYGLAHVSASWTFRTFEAGLGVRNVLDRAYPELVAGGVVSPGQPRTVYFSVRARQ
jgi:outer membrane receptor protein involved in Fe transport